MIVRTLLAVAATTLLTSHAFGAALVCRGGSGTLGLAVDPSAGASVRFYYQKSTQPAGAGLAPGQCSWTDHGMSNADAPCLEQFGVTGAAWIFPGQTQNSYPNINNAAWVRDFLRADRYQTFQVSATGACYRVDGFGG